MMSRPNNKNSIKSRRPICLKDLEVGDLIKAYFTYVYTELSCANQPAISSYKTIKAVFLGVQKTPAKLNKYYFYALGDNSFNFFITKKPYVQELKKIVKDSG